MRISASLPTRDEIARVLALHLPPAEERELFGSMTKCSIGHGRPAEPPISSDPEGER
jgi:hypothetical protein